MGTYDDDRYYRELDRRREEQRDYYRRQDDLRRQRDEDFYREQDRRRDNFLEDQEYERRRREEERTHAYEAMRRGDTSEALRNLVGPEAAIDYLSRTSELAGSSGGERVPHAFVDDLAGLAVNVAAPPAGTSFVASRLDSEGDAVVDVYVGREMVDIFWVRASFVDRLAPSDGASERCADLIRQIMALRDGRRLLSGDSRGSASDASTLDLPYSFVGDMNQLLAITRAAPFARFEASAIDSDGDLPVTARFAGRSSTFWVRAPFLDELDPDLELPFSDWAARMLLREILWGRARST